MRAVIERAQFDVESFSAFGKRLAIRRFGKAIPDGPRIAGIARCDIGGHLFDIVADIDGLLGIREHFPVLNGYGIGGCGAQNERQGNNRFSLKVRDSGPE
jgi:hypothetical protein